MGLGVPIWRHDRQMSYRERPTIVPGVVLWQRTVGPAPELTRILPDGCLDLVWDGRRLFVAGPDSTARLHQSRAGVSYVALRFSGGTGPALLGTPADAGRDQTPDNHEVWPAADAAQVAAGCGYADQARLSRGVRACAGTTPTGLLRELGSR